MSQSMMTLPANAAPGSLLPSLISTGSSAGHPARAKLAAHPTAVRRAAAERANPNRPGTRSLFR
jgi:hypothetical protein